MSSHHLEILELPFHSRITIRIMTTSSVGDSCLPQFTPFSVMHAKDDGV
jgi:hypothetical protein